MALEKSIETSIGVNQGGHQYALCVVGQIIGADGYHLNVRNIDFDLTALEPYRVIPKNPVCIWA
jgi:hypothetical protein